MTPDLTDAVYYHTDKFPPTNLNADALLMPLAKAVSALSRYDVMLQQMRDSEILLSSLRRQEAVISSRMEGTITTLEEVLSAEADNVDDDDTFKDNYRHEAIEALAYSSAMRIAQYRLTQGSGITESLIKSMHHRLLRFARGNHLAPGEYKIEQNYLADRSKKKILFVPVSPEQLKPSMERLIDYLNNSEHHPLIKSAISHIEFEALHPFNDGNGRMGRMLITLYLWQSGVISAPHFYVSEYFEDRRDLYIDRMRAVSSDNAWTEWVVFFLEGLHAQAQLKCAEIEKIQKLYEDMQIQFKIVLASKDFMAALNFLFEMPIFRSSNFMKHAKLTRPTATRFLKLLRENNLISIHKPGAGRRPAMYAFTPLLNALKSF